MFPQIAMFFFLIIVSATPARAADDIRVVTWNAQMFGWNADTPSDGAAERTSRTEDFRQFASATKPDVLLLQEVASEADARLILELMGLQDWTLVVSDFTNDGSTQNPYGRLEVAIASRHEIASAIEFDVTPEVGVASLPTSDVYLQQRGLAGVVPVLRNAANGETSGKAVGTTVGLPPTRGFLWVQLKDYPLGITAVHLKSSRGKYLLPDHTNALMREFVAAHLAHWIAQQRNDLPSVTQIIGGDFNVAPEDPLKMGTDLTNDCAIRHSIKSKSDLESALAKCKASSQPDGYDDTYALLTSGLIAHRTGNVGADAGLKMQLVGADIGSTYVSKGARRVTFPDSPIDTFLAAGEASGSIIVEKSNATFGSDHYPVIATVEIAKEPDGMVPGVNLENAVKWQTGKSYKRVAEHLWDYAALKLCEQIEDRFPTVTNSNGSTPTDNKATASDAPNETWGVVLDADETFVDNAGYQVRLNGVLRDYDSKSWAQWTKMQADHAAQLPDSDAVRRVYGIESALAFIDQLNNKTLCGRDAATLPQFKIAVITNRKGESDNWDEEFRPYARMEEQSTAALLNAMEIGHDCLLLRTHKREKRARRGLVANGESDCGQINHVVLYAGDKLHDLPDANEEASLTQTNDGPPNPELISILLPNPMY